MNVVTQHMKLKDALRDISIALLNQRYAESVESKYRKYLNGEYIRKGVTPEDLRFVKGERAIIGKITTLRKDRDGEVVLPEGAMLRDYLLHPVVMYGHDYSELPIGKNLWIKPDSAKRPTALIAKTQYAPKAASEMAEKVYQYRKAGFPLAHSIGFIPVAVVEPGDKAWKGLFDSWVKRYTEYLQMKDSNAKYDEPAPRRFYTKWILLEYSDVAIPSNQDALAMARAKGLVLPEEIYGMNDIEIDIDLSEIRYPGIGALDIDIDIDLSKIRYPGTGTLDIDLSDIRTSSLSEEIDLDAIELPPKSRNQLVRELLEATVALRKIL